PSSRRRQVMPAPRKQRLRGERIGRILHYSAPGARPSASLTSLPRLRSLQPFSRLRLTGAQRLLRSAGGLLPFATLTNSPGTNRQQVRRLSKPPCEAFDGL